MPIQNSALYLELRRALKQKPFRLAVLVFIVLVITSTIREAQYGFLTSKCVEGCSEQSSEDGAMMNSAAGHSVVGKVHALFGEHNPAYERALRLHEEHSENMGHPMFVLRETILSGLWSKPAYILSIVLQELARPKEARLQWLLWNDADIVVMNPNIPLDVFIPPKPEFDYVNLLVTNDRHGLNNGAFLIRVNDWSVKLLSAVIAFRHFKPTVELKYSEQSALEEMILDPYWRKSVVWVPQFWFNAFPASTSKKPGAPLRPREFRPGALQIHFAGDRNRKRPERMDAWTNIAEQKLPQWSMEFQQTGLGEEIDKFWAHLLEERKKGSVESGTVEVAQEGGHEGGHEGEQEGGQDGGQEGGQEGTQEEGQEGGQEGAQEEGQEGGQEEGQGGANNGVEQNSK